MGGGGNDVLTKAMIESGVCLTMEAWGMIQSADIRAGPAARQQGREVNEAW